MKNRVRRRNQIIVVLSVLLFLLILVTLNTVWPAGFTVVLAIAGIVGGLMVLYEVRLTKRIAEAEFIRDLQTSFTSDPLIAELWRKLLLKESITADDRHLMSNYLTFFETMQLLQSRGVVDLTLADDLFRNRFFTAVGHPVIQQEALFKNVDSFTNIHRLVRGWHDHLLHAGLPIHPGYYSYVAGALEAKGFRAVSLNSAHLPDLMSLQDTVLSRLEDASWLRKNSEDMLRSCLADDSHFVLGIFSGENLVAAAVLYDGHTSKESIKRYLTQAEESMRASVNLKLVLADASFRRQGFARSLVELLEEHAMSQGKRDVLCTIHPKNEASAKLFRTLGYKRVRRVSTSYGPREVFSRDIAVIDVSTVRS